LCGFSGVYSTESWPSQFRGIGFDWASLTGPIGQITGPIRLALITGAKGLMMLQATHSAVHPAYGCLAFWVLLFARTFLIGDIEAKGKALEVIDREIARH